MSATGSRRNRAPRARDVRDQLSEVESMLGQAAKETGEKATALFSQVEAKLRSATDAVQSLQEDAIGRARAAGRVADDYVSDNPWQMVGVAAAIGFLAGALLSRR
jgi:ElaB/YqjD/DUF883 family membrane-anchored ribosome-binding protein